MYATDIYQYKYLFISYLISYLKGVRCSKWLAGNTGANKLDEVAALVEFTF